MYSASPRAAGVLLAGLSLSIPARAQECVPIWTNLDNLNGVGTSMQVVDDGSGPALFIAGQNFFRMGAPGSSDLVRWRGGEASFLSAPDLGSSSVYRLRVLELGGVQSIYAMALNGVHRWNGTIWQRIVPSISVFDAAVFTDQEGEALYTASGQFVHRRVLGGETRRIAMTESSYLDASLAVWDEGAGPRLYYSGLFVQIDGVPFAGIAKWDGTNWSEVGGGFGGEFPFGNGGPGAGILAVHNDGSGAALYAGGYFDSAGGLPAGSLARWDGAAWSAVGGAAAAGNWIGSLKSIDLGSGPQLFAAGWFQSMGDTAAECLARWDGSSWSGYGGFQRSEFDAETLRGAMYEVEQFSDASGPALFVSGDRDVRGAGNANLRGPFRFGCVCPDLDGNGEVDLADLATLLAHFGLTANDSYHLGDIDMDRVTDLGDLAAMLSNFGRLCE